MELSGLHGLQQPETMNRIAKSTPITGSILLLTLIPLIFLLAILPLLLFFFVPLILKISPYTFIIIGKKYLIP
jgi:hypothetical protein